MTRTRYGMIAGLAGAAVACAWWLRRPDRVVRGMTSASHERESIS